MCSIVPLAVAGLAYTSVGVRRQVHFLLALQRAHSYLAAHAAELLGARRCTPYVCRTAMA